MFRYNSKANYQPNGGRYLQVLSDKYLYKQTIVVSSKDTFPARFPNIFVDYPLGKCVWVINCGRTGIRLLCGCTGIGPESAKRPASGGPISKMLPMATFYSSEEAHRNRVIVYYIILAN